MTIEAKALELMEDIKQLLTQMQKTQEALLEVVNNHILTARWKEEQERMIGTPRPGQPD